MANINPHINYNGNAEEAFNFYKSVFGGSFSTVKRFKDLASADFPIPENEADKIMHIALPIGNTFLMGNDVPEIMGRTNENENRSKIVISAESKEEADNIEAYCEQEIKDRTCGEALNPGNSYKIRMDLWQALMSKDEEKVNKFDYTYSERINNLKQLDNAIAALKEDIHSRRSLISIWDPKDSCDVAGFSTRVPCSISYQFLIRNNKLMVLYYIRSNDYFKHFVIDIWLTHALQEYVRQQVLDVYPNLKCGSLNYYGGSMHAYNDDLSKWVIY